MQVKLTVTGGKANKSELSVTVPVVVGRSRAAGLTIAHAMVSRQHCEIFEAGGALRIRDLGSTNGTYVGGNKVEEAVLQPHDQFTIGPLTFEIEYEIVDDSTGAGEGIAGLAGAPAAVLSPEAYPVESEHPPVVTPAPDAIAETAEPSDALSEAYAEFAESAIADSAPAPKGFDFLTAPSEPIGPLAPVESTEGDFEFLDPSAEPIEPFPGDSEIEAPVEDFESAESAEEFMPAEEGERSVEHPDAAAPFRASDPIGTMPAEPPAEFAEPGPDVSAMEFADIAPPDGRVPNFLGWSAIPTGDVTAPGASESTNAAESALPLETEPPQDDVSAFPAAPIAPPRGDSRLISGQAPVWGDSSGSQSDGQDAIAFDSDPNGWGPSAGGTETAPFVPAPPSGKRKTKAGWWPFGKSKADRRP